MVNRIPAKQITAWSFSRYSDYKLCPLKAKLKHIDKIKEPQNDAMVRGARIHDLAEAYIKGVDKRGKKVTKLAPELKQFAEDFKSFRNQYKKKISGMTVEDTWAFTKEWDETTWNDWVNCWLRVKLDCAHHYDEETLIISDWKTGKYREDNKQDYIEQLELYALSALLLHEHIEVVMPRLVYLDHGIIYPKPDSRDEELMTFVRNDIPKLKKIWAKRTKPMLLDKSFAPRPNQFCNWCFFRKSNTANNGGKQLCKF